MNDILARVWENLIGRTDGPLTMRLILQPAVAIFFAVRAGIGDARAGRPAFLWSVITDPVHRRDLLLNAIGDIGKVFVMAVVLDVVYQLIVHRWIYPVEAILAATLLAIVPYMIVRGPISRLARGRVESTVKELKSEV